MGSKTVAEISSGLLVFVGVHPEDGTSDLHWITDKTIGIRIFDDENGKMNLAPCSEKEILIISQFTLWGTVRKGYRPSFHRSADPTFARQLYDEFCCYMEANFKGSVKKGSFGKHMMIQAEDDGPVSIWLDSQQRGY